MTSLLHYEHPPVVSSTKVSERLKAFISNDGILAQQALMCLSEKAIS